VWSDPSIRALDSSPLFRLNWRADPWREYAVADSDTRDVTTESGRGTLASYDALGGVVALDGVRAGDTVVVRTNFFPAWTAYANDVPVTLVNKEGQLAFQAPFDGTYRVELRYPRRTAWLLLAWCAVAAGCILLARWPESGPEPPGSNTPVNEHRGECGRVSPYRDEDPPTDRACRRRVALRDHRSVGAPVRVPLGFLPDDLARRCQRAGIATAYANGFLGMGYPALLNVVTWATGNILTSGKLIQAVSGAAILFMLPAVMRHAFGDARGSLWAQSLLAVDAVFVFAAAGETPDLLAAAFMVGGVLAATMFVRRPSAAAACAAGLALGLGYLVRYHCLLLLPWLTLAMAVLAPGRRRTSLWALAAFVSRRHRSSSCPPWCKATRSSICTSRAWPWGTTVSVPISSRRPGLTRSGGC